MMDLDYFKGINDNYGHQTGDTVLRVVGELIRDSMRATDYAGRYGGEEFLLVMSQTEVAQAAGFAEKLRGRIHALEMTGLSRVTVSIGVAGTWKADTDLIARADKRLYEAKANGRNRVES